VSDCLNFLDTAAADFEARFATLVDYDEAIDPQIDSTVAGILADVRARGDAALIEYTQRFDGLACSSASDLELSAERITGAAQSLTAAQTEALQHAAQRLRRYAEHQKLTDWSISESNGTELGQRVSALERVGLYVPGGKAAYPSSVLMNAIPAKVAGVAELVMVVPTPHGTVNDLVLAAALIAGVDRVFTIGGAQAVAALAYGTETVPAVDKIVGPGNAYVAAAKRQVFGKVGIDMLAGPSEILIVADGSSEPQWMAMDLFSQAEHDEDAQAILLCPDRDYLNRVADCVRSLLGEMPRREIIEASLARRGALIKVADLHEAIAIVNRIAPEHLELSVAEPRPLLELVKHAGAIFLGAYSAEALGDYCAGPNHVLPTAGTARFSSPLGVYDFQKRSSIIDCSAEGARELANTAAELARGEGLLAHARSAEFRGSDER